MNSAKQAQHVSIAVLLASVLSFATTIGLPAAAATVRPGRTVQVNLRSDGGQARDLPCYETTYCGHITSISANGRFVVFDSNAPGLVPGDTNRKADIFRHDVSTGKTELVSIGMGGRPAAGPGPEPGTDLSRNPSISANGRYVAFESWASNLVPGDVNGTQDVFVRDMKKGVTTVVSANLLGIPALGASYYASISADGRFVSFDSDAIDLVLGDTNFTVDTFVRNLRTEKTQRVSIDSDGNQGTLTPVDTLFGSGGGTSISATGRYVAFTSSYSNLVAGDTNHIADVFVHDTKTGDTVRASLGTGGSQAEGLCGSAINQAGGGRSLTPDGEQVVFHSGCENLVPNDQNRAGDVFVHNLRSHKTHRLSVTSAGVEGDEISIGAAISDDGRFVTYGSASALVDGDETLDQWDYDVFVYDRVTGATVMASRANDGSQASRDCQYRGSVNGQMDASGRFVSFSSCADNLTPGKDLNPGWGVFRRDNGPALGAMPLKPSISLEGRPDYTRRGIAGVEDEVEDVNTFLTNQGANFSGGFLVYRPRSKNLFVRLEMESMPDVSVVNPTVEYMLELIANDRRFQVHVHKMGPNASFTLSTISPSGITTKVGQLRGGYGTTGEEIVFAIPLEAVGLERGGRLSRMNAFTSIGPSAEVAQAILPVDTLSFARRRSLRE